LWLLCFTFHQQCIRGNTFCCLNINILIGLKQYLTVVLTCTFLITRDAEYNFIFLLVVCLSLETWPFKSFAHFLISLFPFLSLSYKCSFYILMLLLFI
jgi:hypothetical protein